MLPPYRINQVFFQERAKGMDGDVRGIWGMTGSKELSSCAAPRGMWWIIRSGNHEMLWAAGTLKPIQCHPRGHLSLSQAAPSPTKHLQSSFGTRGEERCEIELLAKPKFLLDTLWNQGMFFPPSELGWIQHPEEGAKAPSLWSSGISSLTIVRKKKRFFFFFSLPKTRIGMLCPEWEKPTQRTSKTKIVSGEGKRRLRFGAEEPWEQPGSSIPGLITLLMRWRWGRADKGADKGANKGKYW